MKALKYIIFLILIGIIAIAIYTSLQPSEYDIQRSRVINIPEEIVYNNIIDFKNWASWGPWQEQDPTMTYTYPDKTKGIGGSYSWIGKDGKGSMETLKEVPFSSIEQKITFEDFEPSTVYWNFEPEENGTKVTWGMKGTKNFMFKLYTLVAGSMDETVGPMYERGLEKLDSILLDDISKYSTTINGVTQHGGGYYIYKSTSTKMSDVARGINNTMPKIIAYAAKNNITAAGAPFIIYHKWDEENNATVFSVCYPTTDRVITADESSILTGELKPFTALKATLKGNYSNLQETWNQAMEHIKQNGLQENTEGTYIESYSNYLLNHPNPSDWITEIYIPLQPADK
ncbi:SRPBCC family protein [Ascidiimonas sp. W6]|uniref:SRPBCC family protein n=1 Tax=Ascidiimonas meishanensis TaxID=3128903 RepID=UPI0030EB9304